MRIAIDFDDTVADQTRILLPLMNWKLGTDIKFEELDWDYFHRTPEMEKAFWDIHDLYDTSYLRRAMPPVDPFAFPVIKELQRVGHTVHIVTRNDPKSHPSIKSWLFMHGLELEVRAIGRGGGEDKARLTYDVFVDDNPNLVETVSRHPTKRMILFTRPWNRKVEVLRPRYRNITRADNWLEVRRKLQLWENG